MPDSDGSFHDADVIVVGSGPSGVSVAFPLLEAGLRVLMLDGGQQRDPDQTPAGSYHDIRRNDASQWRFFLGRRLEALRAEGAPSPKFDAPGSRFAFEGFAQSQRIEGLNFTVVGSLAAGGLSNIWGAGIAVYGDDDLEAFPVNGADLRESYLRIAGRMGITGFGSDDLGTDLDDAMPQPPPLPLCENARRLQRRYEQRRDAMKALGFRMGRSRAAVLTEPRDGRGACALCDMCVWGCRHEAIWSAVHDLAKLSTFERFDYRPGHLAESITPRTGGWSVRTRDRAQGTQALASPVLVLAAGTLATTRLALAMQQRFDAPIPITGTPTAGFALCMPERLGAETSTREFSMGQLSFVATGQDGRAEDRAFGSLFPASGIPGSLTINRMPLTKPAAVRLFRYLQPSLLFGNCFLPGHYSRNTATLERTADGGARLLLRGGIAQSLPGRLTDLQRQLRRSFRRLGAFLIPSSFTAVEPGQDLRYSCTFPMSANPGPGQVDRFGEVFGAPGLHMVDLSIFPAMPAKHHVFTMMANADRIGHGIAEGWESRGRRAA